MNEDARDDLGVLFVHGIGQQVRGGTLVQFGNPICDWLSRWSGSELTLEECDLDPADHAPAHVRMRSGEAKWLFAECHWADAFHEPSFSDLMKWAFVGLPWVLGAHFNGQITLGILHSKHGRRWRAIARFARAFIASLVSALLVALVAAFFPILFAFAVVPVLRPAVVSLQRLLAAVLGDSYLFVESPVQQAAIVSHFRRDLSWLLSRVKRVAVVAHSQGAAVASFGCKGWAPNPPVDAPISLVTFGSGLPKLQVLRAARALRHDQEHGALFAWLAPLGLLLLAAATYLLPGASWGGLGVDLMLIVFGIGCLFAGSLVTAAAATQLKEENGGLLEQAAWTDISATRDLVSNTSLAEFYATGETRDQIQRLLGLARLPDDEVRVVENLRSRLSDHVTYFKNTDGFLPIVLAALLRAAGATLRHTSERWRMPDVEPVTQLRIRRAAARRKWRVCWRGYATVAWAIVSTALLLRRSSDFPGDFVGSLRQQLGGIDAGLLTLVYEPIRRVVTALPPALTGALSICIVLALVLLLLRGLWAAWDVSDRWRFFAGEDYVLSPEFWGFAVATVVSLEMLSIVALRWPLVPFWFAMFMAGLGALAEAGVALARSSPRTGALFTDSDKRLWVSIARFGATALVLWPLFAGMSYLGLDAWIVERLRLPAVSDDPPRFWVGLVVGLPIWACFLAFGAAAMRRLREWSITGAPAEASQTDVVEANADTPVAPQV